MQGISVYKIRPGLIYTDMTKGVKNYYDKKLQDGFALNNRWGMPDDVASAVDLFASGDFLFRQEAYFMEMAVCWCLIINLLWHKLNQTMT